jgi:cytochrome P450
MSSNKPEIQFNHHTASFAGDRRTPADEIQRACPVGWTGDHGGFWVLSKFDDISFAAKHPELYSSVNDDGNGPRSGVTIPAESNSGGIVEADPPRHTALRRALNPWFSVTAVKRLYPAMESDAAWFVDRFIERGQADLIADLADPFPGLVTCRMLGLPVDNYDEFADLLRRNTYTAPDDPDRPRVDARLTWMKEELRAFCAARRADPQDDVLSHLASIEVGGERLSVDELTAEALILFAAGTDTVTTLTGHTLLHLSRNPTLRDWLREDLSRLDRAFREFMRYFNPVTGLARTVMEDHVVRGQQLREGDRVLLWYQAGNQDPDAFSCPHELQPQRNPNPHLSFGAGPHRCIGAHLAKAQWEIQMAEVLRRLPDYLVDESATTQYPDQSQISGFISMPASFTPGPRLAGRR